MVRPVQQGTSLNGESYFPYSNTPLRKDQPQLLTEVWCMSLGGVQTGFSEGTKPALILTNGLRTVSELANRWYEEQVYKGEITSQYKQLPATLHDNTMFGTYCSIYMEALWGMVALISMQKLIGYDDAHRKFGAEAIKISRGRLQAMLRSLTSLPMYPELHALAASFGVPIASGPIAPVYHRVPRPGSLIGDAKLTTAPAEWTAPPEATDFNVSGKLFSQIEDAIQWLNGAAATTLTDDDKEDIRAIKTLLRMLQVPSNLMEWKDVPAIHEDPTTWDQYIYRGAMVGEKVITGQNAWIGYPTFTGVDLMIEQRGRGAAEEETLTGLGPTYACNFGYTNDVSDVRWLTYGFLGPGVEATTDGQKNFLQRQIRVVQYDLGELISKTIDTQSQIGGQPFTRHQWFSLLSRTSSAKVALPVMDDVDWSVFQSIESIGFQYLRWFSRAIGLPYAG